MIIAITFLILIVIVVYWLYIKRAKIIPGVPNPPGWGPYIGLDIQLERNKHRHLHYFYEQWRGLRSTFAITSPMSTPSLVIAPKPKNLRHILSSHLNNYRNSGTALFPELFGNGIFAANGIHWRPQRHIAKAMFNSSNLSDYMLDVFVKHGHRVLECLRNFEKSGDIIDTQKLFCSYTYCAFSEIAFGKDPDSIYKQTLFEKAFDDVQILMSQRSRRRFWKQQKMFLVGKEERKIAKRMKIIDDYVFEALRYFRTHFDRIDRSKNPDFISRYLTTADQRHSTISDKYLRDIMMNFFVASRDTTAATLTWLFFELDQHPDVARKMKIEVNRIFSENNETKVVDIGKILNVNKINRLVYCRMVICETLRLHPPIPIYDKLSVNKDNLPDGTVVPPNCKIMCSPYIFGRSILLWGPDALLFRPERWRGRGNPSAFKFITFNAGHRSCLGKSMAFLETTVMSAMILYSGIRLQMKHNHDISYDRSRILRFKHGCLMNVKSFEYSSKDIPSLVRDPQK